MKHTSTDTFGTRLGHRLLALLAALVLVAAACGGGSDDATGSQSAAAEGGETGGDEMDDGTDAGDTSGEGSGEDSAAVQPAAGNGVIVADLCSDGAFVNGAISLDDLVGWGVLSSADASVSGPGSLTATAYNDFGALCNIEVANGGDFMTVGISGGSETFDDTAGRSEEPPQQIGDWEVLIVDEISPLFMVHTDADGNRDTLFVNWFPADDSRSNLDEYTRVLAPLAEAIATQATVDIPRIEAPGTPSWYVCDDTSVGVAGVDPATLFATMVEGADVELEVEQDITASFGFTECTVRAVGRNFPFVKVQVQDSGEVLQDTVETFLAGWPEAQADTVGGVDVGIRIDRDFGTGTLFAVVDGMPVEVRVSGDTSTDHTPSLRAAAELVFAAIG